MPGISEKPAFASMLEDISERIYSDTIVEIADQCRQNPSIVTKFVKAAELLGAIHSRVQESPDALSR